MRINKGFKLWLLLGTLFVIITQISAKSFFLERFLAPQSTTPSTNIIDYRSQRRADSRAEKSLDEDKPKSTLEEEIFVKDAERPKNDQELQRRNVEYVAEVIGSLIGTIRSGVRIFVENLRQRPSKQEIDHEPAKRQDLEDFRDDFEFERPQLNITEKQTSPKPEDELVNVQKITSPINQTVQESNEATTEVIDDQTKNEVKLLRKQKRSQKHYEIHPESKDANIIESTNEQPLFPQAANHPEKLINVDSDKANLLQSFPNEKRKRIIKAILAPLITAPVSQASLKSLNLKILHFNSLISEISSEIDSQAENGTALETFKLLNQVGNSTIRARTRLALQQAFYRYARLFLIARKGFKDAGSAVRAANMENSIKISQNLQTIPNIRNTQRRQIMDSTPNSQEDSEKNGTSEISDEYATNSAKANFETGQAFAILILEVFGAIFGLTIGLIAQIQAGVMG